MSPPTIAQKLRASVEQLPLLPVITGFDGFVDEIVQVVAERTSLTTFRPVETISDFGRQITAAAGRSSLRETVINRIDAGGCAINMGDGLAALGLPVTTFATVGEPLHPAFREYARRATLYSWGIEPGKTIAYEFADGKLMFSYVTSLQEFHPDNLRAQLADGRFLQSCRQAKLMAITNWSLFPHMTSCWRFLLEQVFSRLSPPVRFFFDLVDPSSRSEADILDMLEALRRYQTCGPVTLGLNANEAQVLGRIAGVSFHPLQHPGDGLTLARSLREKLGLQEIVIHALKWACAVHGREEDQVFGPYCENPQKSTGAGDRFNAGYVLAALLGFTLHERLVVATHCSGFFVRTARSAALEELARFLETTAPQSVP